MGSTPGLNSLVAVHVSPGSSEPQWRHAWDRASCLLKAESCLDHIVTLGLPLCRDEETDDWDNWQHKGDRPVNTTSSANLAPTAPGLCIIA